MRAWFDANRHSSDAESAAFPQGCAEYQAFDDAWADIGIRPKDRT